MESILEKIRAQNSDLAPIIILAPTQRCGTTLLQRAINAGGDAFIAGENFFLLENYAFGLSSSLNSEEEKRKVVEATKQEFLAGNRGIDGSALFLDYERYLQKITTNFYDLMRQYKNAAEKNGFRQWGFKHQARNALHMLSFFELLPNARVVFITRHVLDTAASFRARWGHMMDTPQKVGLFGHQWAQGMKACKKIQNPLLLIKYEDIAKDEKTFREKVQNFLGATLDEAQFSIKVNNHVPSDNREEIKKGASYIPPAALSPQDIEILLQRTKPVLEAYGYTAERKSA